MAIVFVTVWAVRSLIISGDAVLNEHLRSALATSPWVTQANSGDGFEQSLVRIQGSIPTSDRVIIVWFNAPDYSYAFFWATFWLFPRKVAVVSSLDPGRQGQADAVVSVRTPSEPQPVFSEFHPVTVYTFPDYVVTTYERNG